MISRDRFMDTSENMTACFTHHNIQYVAYEINGVFKMVGIVSFNIWKTIFTSLSRLTIRLLDLAGLHVIPFHVKRFSRSTSIHRLSTTLFAMIIISAINTLVGGCLLSEASVSPLLFFSTAFTSRFAATANVILEMVQPLTIPISKNCHAVGYSSTVNRNLKFL